MTGTMPSVARDIDALLAAHKFSEEGSIFAPEKLRDIECRASFIQASECNCGDSPHENAVHDLALADVPALILAVKQQSAEVGRLRAWQQKVVEASTIEAGIGSAYLDPETAAVWMRELVLRVAENRALRDELEALHQTHVGEVMAHNTELLNERNDLIRKNAALHAEVARLGGGVR